MHNSPDSYLLQDDGVFPNNVLLPLLVYPNVFAGENLGPEDVETTFQRNNWVNSWRNGIFTVHHYHSSAHEVLGVYDGWASVQLGGPKGISLKVQAGDVVVIPAGVAHKNLEQSNGFAVVGAYPKGQKWDLKYGERGERPLVDQTIKRVPLPTDDPVFGTTGPLMNIWNVGGSNP